MIGRPHAAGNRGDAVALTSSPSSALQFERLQPVPFPLERGMSPPCAADTTRPLPKASKDA